MPSDENKTSFSLEGEKLLREQERRIQAILETAADCIITIDQNGRIESFNRAAERTLGYSAEEVIGRNVSMLMPRPFSEEHDGYIENYLKTGNARIIGQGRDVLARRKDGRVIHVHLSVGEYEFDGRRFFTGILHDISDRKETEEEVRRYRDRLEQVVRERTDKLVRTQAQLQKARDEAVSSSAAKTRFLAAASHDLRQPLQAANLLVYLLAQTEQDQQNADLIRRLQESMASFGSLLNSLLDISRLYAGLIVPHRQTFHLGPLLERIQRESVELCAKKGIECRVRNAGFVIESDPNLLEQVLRNLVYNAIKYTPAGRVVIGCRRRGADLAVQVWDTGIGIAPDQRNQIFEEFFQVENPGKDAERGLGLGLSIVQQIARLLDHEIQVRSWPGKGSMFEVLVPHGTVRAAADANPAERHEEIGGRLIVLIDDDEAILSTLSLVLKNWGYSVVAGKTLDEVRAGLEAGAIAPSAIIADYNLNWKSTGAEVIQSLNAELEGECPGILLTGDTSPSRAMEAEELGCELMHKPIDPDCLKATLTALLKE